MSIESKDILPDDDISTIKQESKRIQPSKFKLANLTNRKVLILLVFIFFIILLLITVFSYLKYKQNNNDIIVENQYQPCTDTSITNVIEDTSNALNPENPENINKLPEIADKILTLDNHENDAFCLNILTTRYVVFGINEEANKYYSLLENKLNEENLEDLPQKDYFLKMEELQKNVEVINEKTEQIQKNNPYTTDRWLPDGTILPEDNLQ